jgi:hypothetical protein
VLTSDHRVRSSRGPRPVFRAETLAVELYWPDASGHAEDRVRSWENDPKLSETRHNLNQVASNWTLSYSRAA